MTSTQTTRAAANAEARLPYLYRLLAARIENDGPNSAMVAQIMSVIAYYESRL